MLKKQPTTTKRKRGAIPDVVPTQVPRFDVNDEAAYAYLATEGYVVLRDVLSEAEVDQGRDLAWDFLAQRTGSTIRRDNPASWDPWPDPWNKGIIVADGVGQSQLLWHVRGNANVQRAFQHVWNTTELITSFDGFCAYRPTEYNPAWATGGGWYHLDQNGKKKPNKLCVQGFVNFYDSGMTDGGLVVVPRSISVFKDIFKNPSIRSRTDFVSIKPGIFKNEVAGLVPIKICAKAGDLVLWDSRTIHCNTPPCGLRPKPTDGSVLPLRRLVAYVCMTPASRLKPAVARQRVEAYKVGHTSTHWPEECRVSGRTNTQNSAYKPVRLNASQRALIPMAAPAEEEEEAPAEEEEDEQDEQQCAEGEADEPGASEDVVDVAIKGHDEESEESAETTRKPPTKRTRLAPSSTTE